MENEYKNSCCFFGHRKIDESPELVEKLTKAIENLITDKNVYIFYFGSKSEFDSLCLKVITDLKEIYSHIKRVYVRSAYPDINESYENYLLESYEDTYYPEKIRGAGKASYVERNQEMINKSYFCVVYYDESYTPQERKNNRKAIVDYQPKIGTKIAYDYAVKKKRKIINIFTREH